MIFWFFKKIIIVVLIAAVIVFGIFAFMRRSNGQLGGTVPFGGKVIASHFCSCDGSFLLTFAPGFNIPTQQLTYMPFTQQYANYNLGPGTGMWALGLYTPGGICDDYDGVTCSPFGTPAGRISPTVGSSAMF